MKFEKAGLVAGSIKGLSLPSEAPARENSLAVRGGILSNHKETWTNIKTGTKHPGPGSLIGGDSSKGFFGEVASAEFVNGPTLLELADMPELAVNPYMEDSSWLKFSYGGKILYIPKAPLYGSTSWDYLNSKGAVFGKTVTIEGRQFILRLIKGANSDPTHDHGSLVFSPSAAATSEWNDLMYPIGPARTTPVWATYSNDDLRPTACWCQETSASSSTKALRRGGNGNIESYYLWHKDTNNYYWRPVLELIE